MKFEELDEFKKDLKQLLKKYPSLNDDLEVVKRVLAVNPAQRSPFSFQLNDLGIQTSVIKLKKIASRCRKQEGASSGLQLIYAWFEQEDRIVLVELFHNKENGKENRQRILKNFN